MNDPFESLRKRVSRTVWHSPATLDPKIRNKAAVDQALPDDLAAFVHKLHEHAYQCTDDEVAALQRAGYTEDQLFELMAAAAVGAATKRLDRALNLLDGGRRAIEEG